MPSINSTPPEIQQKILRHVISVPYFLDPDGVASTDILAMSDYHIHSGNSKWNDITPYYAAERDRNLCRRVCASWNIYLQETIGHRYVDMVDIRHGKLPVSALRTARRVSVSIHSWGCVVCNSKWRNGSDTSTTDTKARGPLEFLRDILSVVGETRTQIITNVESTKLALLADHMPEIVTITSLLGGLGMAHSINRFHQLRHLYVETGEAPSEFHGLNAPNLRTLSLPPQLFANINFAQADWNLPSLLTVRAATGPSEPAWLHTRDVIEPLLRTVGSNIRNLFLPYTYLSVLTPDIWEICPNLENITARKDGSMIEGIPTSHPLRTILIACYGMNGPLISVPITHIPTSSRIRTVVVDCPWDYRFPETLIRDWADYWRRYSIRAENMYGTPVQNCIALLDQRKACSLYGLLRLH